MLYDPKWEKPAVKADPFKLETLIAWLEKQPAAKKYKVTDIHNCLLSQYFQAHGFKHATTSNSLTYCKPYFFGLFGIMVIAKFQYDFVRVAVHGDEHTFGAALIRARALHLAND